MSSVSYATSINPVLEAQCIIRSRISQLSPTEIETRLIAFSLREIDRAEKRINKIPKLSPAEARNLYSRLLRALVIELDTTEQESSAQRQAA